LALLALVGAAQAQDATPAPQISDDQVNAIAKQLFCPVCESTPLDVCPTQACAEWRELIRQQLGQGMTEQQIKQYFVDRYGDRVLAAPPARGLNWLAYLIPPLAILAGIYLLFRAFKAWKQPAPSAAPAQAAAAPAETEVKDPYVQRIEDELRKMK
ncbi:MAG: cytochrome c-type biogenesis protein CcmH, partial [Chloroflexota bacterium]